MAWKTNPEGLMRRTRKAFGSWLSVPRWDWYVTHTFKADYVPSKLADKKWQSWLNTLCFHNRVMGAERPFYVRATEFQDRGTLHYHSLIGGISPAVRRLFFKDIWEFFGFARVVKYDPKRGAGFYVGKYITKDDSELRFSHNITRHLTGL